jgi:hypothetical protein
MRVIFCNVTYLRYYDGRVVGELKPQKGGRWVQENEDAHEKWNFLNMDGKCYGYVQGNSEKMHIEKLDKVYSQQEEADDIVVVWCASNDENKTVVVGWYEHATVYRYLQDLPTTPVTGIERCYWFCTDADNAFLLPEKDRVLEIGRASKTGSGTGFGQQNYWYAESQFAKENIIPTVLDFINKNCGIKFDTELSRIFMRSVATYPTGSMVYMNTGAKAIVLRQNADNPARPVVRLVEQRKEGEWIKREDKDLSEELELFIVDTIDE